MADEKKVEEKKKTLEEDVKFSWMRVIKNGIRNMKDDIDPIYKGAKIGIYTLHGIPTWAREYKDDRLANDSYGWALTTAAFVTGASLTAYYIGTKEAVHQYGPEGYSLLAIPLISQAGSYVWEAFRRAKKDEEHEVFQRRLQKRMNSEIDGEYDLSLNDIIKDCAANAPELKEQIIEVHERRNRIRKARRDYTDLNDDGCIEQADPEPDPKAYAQRQILRVADNVFDQLFAQNQVGKKYTMRKDFGMINIRMTQKNKRLEDFAENLPGDYFSKMIWENVSKNGGSANIELLGKVTAIYSGEGASREVVYRVEPNQIWKR